MRTTVAVAVCLAMVVPTATQVAAQQRQPVIAVFTKNRTNPAYDNFRLGADKVAQAAGARTIHYVPDKPDDVGEQTAQIEDALKNRPDIVIFTPVDDKAMIEPVKKLNDAGIPVVLFTNPLPGKFVTFVGADDVEIGYKEAKFLFDRLGGKGRIVVIEGTPAAPTNRDRLKGYQRAFVEYPGIQVLGSEVGNYQRTDARRVMTKLIKEHAEIDAVLSANDSMSLGVLDALKDAGRTTTVMSINGIIDAVKEVAAGNILATVEFNTFTMACLATHAALRHLDGQPVPERVMVPSPVITKNNYQPWLVPMAERPCPPWNELVN